MELRGISLHCLHPLFEYLRHVDNDARFERIRLHVIQHEQRTVRRAALGSILLQPSIKTGTMDKFCCRFVIGMPLLARRGENDGWTCLANFSDETSDVLARQFDIPIGHPEIRAIVEAKYLRR